MKKTLALLLVAATTAAHATLITYNFAEVNGDPHSSGFPQPLVSIGTANFVIPSGETIVSATLSGTFGQTSSFFGSTAHHQLFADGQLVADTMTYSPNPYNNVVPWSFNYASFTDLLDGQLDLGYVQTSDYIVRLSETTLTINTRPTGTVPDSAGFSCVAMALGGLFAFARRFKAIKN